MSRLHKRLFFLLIVGVASVFGLFVLSPYSVTEKQSAVLVLAPQANEPIQIHCPGASTFSDEGMFLCRPEIVHDFNVYCATIDMTDIIENGRSRVGTSFHPEIHALVRINDEWIDIGQGNSDFYIDTNEDSTNYSVKWYLRESAPAAVYGIRCSYDVNNDGSTEKEELVFQVLYTQDWTYINVENDFGERRITNYWGGSGLTLYLNVTYNNGAANPSLVYSGQTTGTTGVHYGSIRDTRDIVSVNNMEVVVKTLSGKVYPASSLYYEIDSNNNNRILLRFAEKLGNDVYFVQLTSDANKRIIGQFVIDNSDGARGVNLSQFWVLLMIVGGLLTLGAATVFLVPFVLIRVNESRVYKENERVDRMKNPEKYVESDKNSLKGTINKIIYNIKTPAYERKRDKEKEEQAKPVEEKVYTNRFTEMLKERQEKREFMREHNITSVEMDKMKETEEVAKKEEASSFAFLRDDDDEIATFHAAQDDISTLETGSYVEDGTTFAKLDSLKDDINHHGNDDNGEF